MSLLEDRILRIIELKRNGKNDLEVAQELGVAPAMIFEYQEAVVGAFRKAFDQGYPHSDNLAEHLDFSPITVGLIMAYYDLTPPPPEQHQEITLRAGTRAAFTPFHGACTGDTPAIAQAIQVGQEFADSLDELSRQLQLNKSSVRRYAQQYGIKLRFEDKESVKESRAPKPIIKRKKKILSQRKGDILDHDSIQKPVLPHACSKPTRREAVTLSDELSRELLTQDQQREFLSTLDCHITTLAGQKGWAYQKAWQYLQHCRKSTHSLGLMVELFDTYDYAQLRGVALSLQELGEGVSLRWTSVSRILHTVGLNPLYGTKAMYKVSPEKKAALKKIVDKKILPIRDLSYFLELPSRVAEKIFAQRKIKVKPTIKKFWQDGKAVPLTYRSASQIYQARDLGFVVEEVAHLLDKPLPMICYAYDHEKIIAPRIMQALTIMYPSEKIMKPYR